MCFMIEQSSVLSYLDASLLLLRFDRNAFELLDALSLTPEESDPNV